MDQQVYQWQIWCTYDPYRKVHTLRCPNLDGVIRESEDKQYAKAQVINDVCGYINRCHSSGVRVDLLPPPDTIPGAVVEVIRMNSV